MLDTFNRYHRSESRAVYRHYPFPQILRRVHDSESVKACLELPLIVTRSALVGESTRDTRDTRERECSLRAVNPKSRTVYCNEHKEKSRALDYLPPADRGTYSTVACDSRP